MKIYVSNKWDIHSTLRHIRPTCIRGVSYRLANEYLCNTVKNTKCLDCRLPYIFNRSSIYASIEGTIDWKRVGIKFLRVRASYTFNWAFMDRSIGDAMVVVTFQSQG